MTKRVIEVDSRDNLHAIIEANKSEHKSVRKRKCDRCGKPCGESVYYTWYHGKRVAHYPKCKLIQKR